MTNPNNEPVDILISGDQTVLAIAQAYLAGENIPFFLSEQAMQTILPVDGFSLAPTRIRVPAEFAELAKEILAPLTQESTEEIE